MIGSAGALGALSRYGLGLLIPTASGGFPWGVFVINVTGSFAIGLVLVLLAERFPHAQLARPLVTTGFLGAYTTFSTYAVDVDLALRSGNVAVAVADGLGSLAAGALAAVAGIACARLLLRLEERLGA